MVLVGAASAGAASTRAAGGSICRLSDISTGCVLGNDRLRRATTGLATARLALVEPAVLTARTRGENALTFGAQVGGNAVLHALLNEAAQRKGADA